MKHEAFRSGDFDTNFVKQYFSDTAVIKDAMEEEKAALLASVDQIWNQIQKNKQKEFVSKPIHGAWKLMKK
jgi:propionyl-CoA carboxylase alpha chain